MKWRVVLSYGLSEETFDADATLETQTGTLWLVNGNLEDATSSLHVIAGFASGAWKSVVRVSDE